MNKSLLTRSLVALFLLTIVSTTFFAQPGKPRKDGDRFMFVEIDNLDVATYEELVQALDGNELMVIHQACVPAHVIMLDIPASNRDNLDNNFTALRDIVVTNTSLTTMRLLAEYGEKDFLAKCKKYRGSGQP
ncbi:MAG: hypothetical protein SH856_08445 [Flavobacteriales bacterium]|nr:hypothetical protein [Flavobacteriales bacterium]